MSDGATAGGVVGAPIDVALLGPLEVRVDGRPVAVGGTRSQAVLAALALRPGHVVPLDALVAAVWDDRPPASATNTVQSYVSRLRRTLALPPAPPPVRSAPGGYVLDVEPPAVDAVRFDLLARRGHDLLADDPGTAAEVLERALRLWRGPALVGFAGSALATAAVALAERRATAREDLVDARLAVGATAGLIGELEELVADAPLRERRWGQLMVALHRDGRQAEALRCYQRCRAVLADELGLDPGAALRALERRILEQDPDLGVAAAPPPVRHPPSAPPVERRPTHGPDPGRRRPAPDPPASGQDVFVGRTSELRTLEAALASARHGAGALVVVLGEAGIGKTALVRHFAGAARTAGARVRWGRAWEEEGAPPFWPWVEVVRSHDAGEGGGPPAGPLVDLAELLPEVAVTRSTAPAAQERFRLFEAVAARLLDAAPDASAAGGATVLVLEDLHGADAGSLALLRHVVRRSAASPTLLVVTGRPPDDARGAWSATLAELAREPLQRRVALGPLADDDVGQLLARSLGAPAPPDLLAAVQRWAEGHPFFVTELVHLLEAPGAGGSARLLERFEVPQGLAQMIARRLAALPDEAVRVLTAASVIGRDFDAGVLRRVAPVGADAVLDALDAGRRAGLVDEVDAAGAFRFSHALVRESLYRGTGAVRRARLHERVAEVLESGETGPADGRAAEVAHHRLASIGEGGAAAAVAAATRAADRAMAALAYEEAARLRALALDAADRHPGAGVDRGALGAALGEAQLRAGDVAAARRSFLAVAATARDRGDPALLARAALGLGGGFEALMYDGELVALLEDALAALPADDAPMRARLLARLAMAVYLDDGQGRRMALSAAALDAARASGDAGAGAAALSARFFCLWGPRHQDERAQLAEEALDLAWRSGDRELELDGVTWAAMEALGRADRPAFDRHAARHRALAVERRHPLHRYYAAMWDAMVAALEGRFVEAEATAHRAHELGRPLTEMALPRRSVLLLSVLRETGRLRELVDDVDVVVATYPLFGAVWGMGRALLHLELGDPGPARRVLDDLVASPATALPEDANWASGMVFLAESAVRLHHRAAAAAVRSQLAGYQGRCASVRFGAACWGAIDRYSGLLAGVLGERDAAVRHLEEGLAVNVALRARPLVARTHHDLARALLDRGRSGDDAAAAGHLDAAERTARDLGMVALLEDVAGDRRAAPAGSAPVTGRAGAELGPT